MIIINYQIDFLNILINIGIDDISLNTSNEDKAFTFGQNSKEDSEVFRPNKEFCRRQDVINKTLLRSLKKFITTDFSQNTNFDSLTYAEKQIKYKELLSDYVKTNYTGKDIHNHLDLLSVKFC